jgi:hypothetical protein
LNFERAASAIISLCKGKQNKKLKTKENFHSINPQKSKANQSEQFLIKHRKYAHSGQRGEKNQKKKKKKLTRWAS